MFDPYHKWLGIAKEEQPPTYYRLLGINANEQDRDVIEEAAIRQTTHVRTNQIGPHAAACSRLLNEIAHARATLLDPVKRREYDLTLASKSPPAVQRTADKGPKRLPPWLWAAAASGVVALGIVPWIASSLMGRDRGAAPPSGPPPDTPTVTKSPQTPPEPKKPQTPIVSPMPGAKEVPPGKPVVSVAPPKPLVPEMSQRFAKRGGKGSWHIDGEHLISDEKGSSLEFGDPKWKDYDFTFVAQRVTGEFGFAAIFRASGSGSGDRYAALLPSRAANGFFHIIQQSHMGTTYRSYDGKGKSLPGSFAGKTSPLRLGQEYRIKISVRGLDCECFLDDKRVMKPAKLEYEQGAVGVQNLAGGMVRIRDIKVQSADGQVLWEGLPRLP
jgi:hypothetical protein